MAGLFLFSSFYSVAHAESVHSVEAQQFVAMGFCLDEAHKELTDLATNASAPFEDIQKVSLAAAAKAEGYLQFFDAAAGEIRDAEKLTMNKGLLQVKLATFKSSVTRILLKVRATPEAEVLVESITKIQLIMDCVSEVP